MSSEIISITPVVPGDVGDRRFEFRVLFTAGEQQLTVDLSAEELLRHDKFQEAALKKTGWLVDFGVADLESESERYRRWQRVVASAEWRQGERLSYDVRRMESAPAADDDEDLPRFRDEG